MEDRFSKLELEGRPVQVLPYASAADCNIITDALNKFDPDYSIDYRSKSLLKKMPIIASFINCPKHCRMMEYSVEFRLCGITGCDLCKKRWGGLYIHQMLLLLMVLNLH